LLATLLLGVAHAQEARQEGRVTRFDPDTGTLALDAGGRARTLRVTADTRFTVGKGTAIANRTGRLVLRRGLDLRFAAGAGDALAEVVLDALPRADTSRMKPLPDLGTGTYEGRPGGLYPGGRNERPEAHEKAGLARAAAVVPRDADGKPAASGRIVVLSVGMSNCTQEFSAFQALAGRDRQVSPRVLLLDGAQGGMTAFRIRDPESPEGRRYWTTSDARLAAARATPAQVQVVWLKEADAFPTAGLDEYAASLQSEMESLVRTLARRFPNLALCYLSSRTYGGYATSPLNPEPYAYESAFAVRGLIEAQIRGAPGLSCDASKGRPEAPWLAWGPYLWANAESPSADALSYEPADFAADGTHPSPQGQRKIAERLLRFFKTDRTARGWFLGT